MRRIAAGLAVVAIALVGAAPVTADSDNCMKKKTNHPNKPICEPPPPPPPTE